MLHVRHNRKTDRYRDAEKDCGNGDQRQECRGIKGLLCDIVVRAVTMVADPDGTVDIGHVNVQKKVGGKVEDTDLIEGMVIDKERAHPGMPKSVKNAKILLLNAALEFKKTEVNAKINISTPGQVQAFLDEDEQMVHTMVDKIVKSGATVVFCQKGIDDVAQHYLAKAGIFAVRRVKKSDIENLARATGANDCQQHRCHHPRGSRDCRPCGGTEGLRR